MKVVELAVSQRLVGAKSPLHSLRKFGERTSALRITSRLHFPYDLPQNAEPELDVAGGEV